jgi:hypothetical protein
MIDPLDLSTSFRRKADECRGHARSATEIMLRMEWIQLAEHWQVLADDFVFANMVRPFASMSKEQSH